MEQYFHNPWVANGLLSSRSKQCEKYLLPCVFVTWHITKYFPVAILFQSRSTLRRFIFNFLYFFYPLIFLPVTSLVVTRYFVTLFSNTPWKSFYINLAFEWLFVTFWKLIRSHTVTPSWLDDDKEFIQSGWSKKRDSCSLPQETPTAGAGRFKSRISQKLFGS